MNILLFFFIFSGNIFVMLVGWDGLGVVSFLLVIFYGRPYVLDAGLLTVFSNRVGDAFFLLFFGWFFASGGLSPDFLWGVGVVPLLFVFLGAVTKRAQLPFSSWLPAAMAAPTPVSSLVHSSTLVTAGVYVLLRYNFSFVHSVFFYSVSLSTFFLAGVGAFFEMDFKKVVAMSTLSQLGFMIFCLSVGLWGVSFFHIVLHAVFKSMLFLSCGVLMVSLGGGQDSRFFGGSASSLSFVGFFTRVIRLGGFPFSVGFYRKDTIILGVCGAGFGWFSYVVFLLSCLLSVA